MQKTIATIFNNVMGPVTAGPSTSNTCGPGRIAYLCRCLLNEEPLHARVVFPEDSTYPCTYRGMKTDCAFANGLLGRLPDDSDFLYAFERLRERGISLEFEISSEVHAAVPLTSYIELSSKSGQRMEIVGVSKGGGIIELIRVNGFTVFINGETDTALLFLDSVASVSVKGMVEVQFGCTCEVVTKEGGQALLLCRFRQPVEESSFIKEAEALPHIQKARYLPAVLPVVVQPGAELPFSTAAELLQYCGQTGKPLWQAAVDYEVAVSGWTARRVYEAMGNIIRVARRSAQEGLRPGIQYAGILPAKAAVMHNNFQAHPNHPCGLLSKAGIYSTAIMEYSNASGVVVCIPSAGASGVVSGLLLAAGEELSLSDEELIKAYFCAGAIGVVCSEENDFCGAQYGCQAEVGFASAFAAAGYAYLLGCDAPRIVAASSMALQNMLGLVCDPVCGFVQVPCYARNMGGVSNAIASADAVWLGFDPCIPLDETFQVLKKIGNGLPRELRGCGGGLCWSSTAKALQDKLK